MPERDLDFENMSEGRRNDVTIRILSKLSTQGDAEGQYLLGKAFYHGEYALPVNYEEAFQWCQKSANQGYADAQHLLSIMYVQGRGVKKDIFEGLSWLIKSKENGLIGKVDGILQSFDNLIRLLNDANAGNTFAQFHLGKLYYNGFDFSDQDLDKAISWWKKSAQGGFPDAQDGLGFCYMTGRGVKANHQTSVFWYQKAAAQGNEHAKAALRVYGLEK